MRKEMKICLPVYKIVYSLAFIVILCFIRGISYTEEIGAMEEQVALLAVVFCADTYLIEVQSGRSDILKLCGLKKRTFAVFRRLLIQMLYLLGISAIGYLLFHWQSPVILTKDYSGKELFVMFLAAAAGTILFWSLLSVIVSGLFRNIWAGIGSVLIFWLSLTSKAGNDLLGKWNVFSYANCAPKELGDWQWMCGKLVSLALAAVLAACLPIILKKKG